MFRLVLQCYLVVILISLASSYVPVKGGRHSIKPKDTLDNAPIDGQDEVVLRSLIQEQQNSDNSQIGVTSKSVIEDASKNIAEELNHKSNTYSNNREEQVDINQSKRDSSTSHTENHHTNNGREQKHVFKEVKESSHHDEVAIRNQVIYNHGGDLSENAERSNRSENEYQLSINDDNHKVSVSNQDGKNVETNHNEEFLHVSNKQDPSKYHIEQHSSFDGVRIDKDQNTARNHQSKQVSSEVPVDIHKLFVSNSEGKFGDGHQQNEESLFKQSSNSEFSDKKSDNENNKAIFHNVGTDSLFISQQSHDNNMGGTQHQNRAESSLNNHNSNSNLNENGSDSQHINGFENNKEQVPKENTNDHKLSIDKTYFHEDNSKKNTEINFQEQSSHTLSEDKHHLDTLNKEQNLNTKNVHFKKPNIVKMHDDSQHEFSLEHSNEDSFYDHDYGHSYHHGSTPYHHDPHHQNFEHHHHPHSFDHSLEDYDDYHFDSHHDYHHGHGSHGHGHH